MLSRSTGQEFTMLRSTHQNTCWFAASKSQRPIILPSQHSRGRPQGCEVLMNKIQVPVLLKWSLRLYNGWGGDHMLVLLVLPMKKKKKLYT